MRLSGGGLRKDVKVKHGSARKVPWLRKARFIAARVMLAESRPTSRSSVAEAALAAAFTAYGCSNVAESTGVPSLRIVCSRQVRTPAGSLSPAARVEEDVSRYLRPFEPVRVVERSTIDAEEAEALEGEKQRCRRSHKWMLTCLPLPCKPAHRPRACRVTSKFAFEDRPTM